jgi:hypothetical protein
MVVVYESKIMTKDAEIAKLRRKVAELKKMMLPTIF